MKKPKAPAAPNPTEIIRAQTQANRVGIKTPFGSQTYQTGPNGSTTLETSYSPEMTALAQSLIQRAGQSTPGYQAPAGMEQILGGIMNRVGNRYGQGGGVGAQVAGSGGRGNAKPSTLAKPLPMPKVGGGADGTGSFD
jgi:hypothetical protein